MPAWLGTTIAVLAIAVIVGLIVFKYVKDRRAGKSGCSCGCGCEHCTMDCPSKAKTQKQ